ncbi:MAG: iron-containing alcohol dehydrogenase [Limnochordia bacterium]|jgi:alcohol dehydrogenase class IV
MLAEVKEFFCPTRVVTGFGVYAQLGQRAAELGMKKPMVVSDQGIAQAGILERGLQALEEAGIEYVLFDEVNPDPDNELIDRMAKIAAEEGVDSFIGIGGGSPMDASKLVNIVHTHGGSIVEYARDKMVPGPLMPLIAVATTAGTGSEVTRNAVVTDLERKFKRGIGSDYNYPTLSLVDYELIANQPPRIAASTGMDALTHAIEGYTCRKAQPISDALCLRAISLIGANIRAISAGQGDLQAGKGMALGSTIAGMAFSNSSVGLVHAMSQAAGSLCGVPHGIGNAILLPHVMEFNLIGNLERFADVARALGENVEGLTLREAAQAAVEAVWSLNADIGIPDGLGQAGVKEENIDELIELSLMNVNGIRLNPRRVTREDIRAIYQAAL